MVFGAFCHAVHTIMHVSQFSRLGCVLYVTTLEAYWCTEASAALLLSVILVTTMSVAFPCIEYYSMEALALRHQHLWCLTTVVLHVVSVQLLVCKCTINGPGSFCHAVHTCI